MCNPLNFSRNALRVKSALGYTCPLIKNLFIKKKYKQMKRNTAHITEGSSSRSYSKLTPCSTGDVNQPNSAPEATISSSTSVTITQKYHIFNVFCQDTQLQ